jgi:tetratricopeptide (TPR) repeat protein
MNEKASEQLFISTDKDVITTTQLSSCATSEAVQSNITPPRRRILQNHRLIWLNANIDESNDFYQNVIAELQTVVNSVDTFIDPDQCVDCLTDIIQEKVFVIMSKTLSEQIIPLIYDVPQLDTICIFSDKESKEEDKLFKDWSKVKGEYTQITPICEAIRQAVRQCDQNSIPISFVSTDDGTSDSNLDELDSSFMYTQVLKEIILGTEYNRQSIKDLVLYWRAQNSGNNTQLKIIDRFEREYQSDLSIRWYTHHSFTYDMLNRALRTLEADIIIKMGFFICDLHLQLQELHAQQFGSNDATSFTVYRGQGLSNKDFEKLMKTKGGLMSFNNFLSTGRDQQTSFVFAESTLANPGLFGILFKITIDPSISSTPYALISNVSYFKEEEEILFSMHSVFRIGEIEKIDNNDRLYQVELKLTADDDQQLRALTSQIREETYPNQKTWYRITMLLIKVGQFQQAEEICMTAQNELSDDIDKHRFYNVLGMIKNGQGDYEKAAFFYGKLLEISEKIWNPNDPKLATPHNNIASVYFNKGEHQRALSFLEKALEIKQKALSANHPLLAISYNNIGGVYMEMGEYLKGLSFYEQALEIQQDHIPSNHPDLATAYSNIGTSYATRGEYSKALSFLNKALGISEKMLPETHPLLATHYNNIAAVYGRVGEFLKSISFYEQALRIQQEALPPNHPHLAILYSNIGGAYAQMGDYSKALSFHEKALQIREIAFSPAHPDVATSYSNIGVIYNKLGQYTEALFFHKKALEIIQIALPPTHSDLAGFYCNIGSVYIHMKKYSKALPFYEKALNIQQNTLPPNHPDLAISLNNIGLVYNDMGEYLKALLFHEKSLEIRKIALPSNHPALAVSFNNIASVYEDMEENSKALAFYEKGLTIQRDALSPNHPDLATSFNNIGLIYVKMGESSKALSFFEKAKEIFEKIFKPNHPTLATLYNNIGRVYLDMEENSKALCFYEKTLQIRQQTLPENHISFIDSYMHISTLYFQMGQYLTALSYSERAFKIGQKSLPSNHPNLRIMRDYLTKLKIINNI